MLNLRNSLLPSTTLLGLCLALIIPAGSLPAALAGAGHLNSVKQARATRIPMKMHGNRPLIDVYLNGKGPYQFILDTGATIVVIDSSLAAELSLPVTGKSELQSPTKGTPIPSDLVHIDKIEAGTIQVEAQEAQTMDIKGMFGSDHAPSGVLGATYFSGHLLTLDYPGESIVVRPGELGASDGKTIFQYTAEDDFPTVPLIIGDRKIDTHIDTGSPGFIMLPGKLMKELPLANEPKVMGTMKLVDREMDIYMANLEGEAAIGSIKMNNPSLTFGEHLPAGNLGYRFLKDFALTLDIRNRRLKFEKIDQAEQTGQARQMRRADMSGGGPSRRVVRNGGNSNRKRYGMMFRGSTDGAMSISGVQPGSIAEKAGLTAGDTVIRLNGKEIAGMSQEERISFFRGSPLTLLVDRDGEEVRVEMSLD
jgi:predicted aspartyl protease